MRVLVVDLNNFAMYPSIAIGYIVSSLRGAGFDVEVLSPLSHGAQGVTREPRPPLWGAWDQRLRYDSAVSRNPVITKLRKHLVRRRMPKLAREGSMLSQAFSDQLDGSSFDAVLVSTYLMYFDACKDLGELCAKRGIPLIVGGPYFSQPEIAQAWRDIPALSALVGGEIELHLPELVTRVVDKESIDDLPGVWNFSDGNPNLVAPPLRDLDSVPFPDYSDFPWQLYQRRFVPIITGRGCGWGRCMFCSDITSTAGRTYRSRSAENVLDEIEQQSARHDTRDFVFTDLKLNSDHRVWSALLSDLQTRVPGARWVASVHAGASGNDGLSRAELEAASSAGMVRLTTGLESGSQRVLNSMKKGTKLSETARVIRDAHAAGISVRVTMIIGYPGETKEDIDATTDFLRSLDGCIERIVLNRFQLVTGAPVHRTIEREPEEFAEITNLTVNNQLATVSHHYSENLRVEYRRAIHKLTTLVHRVNRRPLQTQGQQFEGVM